MKVPSARRGLGRWGAACAVALAAVGLAPTALQNAVANGDTRTLSFVHTHTHERATFTFKRDGRYDPDGLRQANQFLRDWRRNEVIDIDPRLLDLVWEVYRDVSGSEPIHLVSSYRSPNTNEMLRSRSSGVARESQHTRGKAMDFFIPGVSTQLIREKGMLRQKGGVGFYSGQNGFVHLDVGSVRAWPRLSREHLARLFPNGETLHLPASGPPLSGYATARARGVGGGGETTLAFAQPTERTTRDDASPTQAGAAGGPTARGILTALFGGDQPTPATAPSRTARTTAVASAPARAPAPEREPPAAAATTAPVTANVPLPLPRPAVADAEDDIVTASVPMPLPRPVILASLGSAFVEDDPPVPSQAVAVAPAPVREIAFVAPGLSGEALRGQLAVTDVRRLAVMQPAAPIPADFAAAPDAAPGFGRWRTARTDSFAGPAIRNLVAQRSL